MTFQQALLRRGIRHRAGGDRNKILLCCPFCVERGKTADTQFRLAVHAVQKWGRCMHCDWKSRNAVAFVLRYLGIEGAVEGASSESEEKFPLPTLPVDFSLLSTAADDLDVVAKNYALKRGLTLRQLRDNKVGVSYSGRYAYRIVFPVYVGKVLKFINARAFMGKGEPKYLNSVGDKWLYHFDPAAKTVVLSEGVFKALRIEQACSHNSAALLGHDLNDIQLAQIKESACEHVILFPDIDVVGKKGFVKIADKLSEEWKGRVSFVYPASVPADEASLEDMTALLKVPLTYSWETRQKVILLSS